MQLIQQQHLKSNLCNGTDRMLFRHDQDMFAQQKPNKLLSKDCAMIFTTKILYLFVFLLCSLAALNYIFVRTTAADNKPTTKPNKIKTDQSAAKQWQMLNILTDQQQLLRATTPPTIIRSILLTTWRSGSTFLGDILNAPSGNYYHYEPLLYAGIRQIRDDNFAAADHIRKLLHCNYTDMDEYMKNAEHSELFYQNTRLWTRCHPFCFNVEFVQRFCALFPMQSMKLVRLRLRLIEPLLADVR